MFLLAVKRLLIHSKLLFLTDILIDEMFRTGLYTAFLHTQNCLVSSFSGKEGVCAEAFPVPSTLSNASHIHHRTKSDINSFAFVLLTHEESTGTDKLTVESKCQDNKTLGPKNSATSNVRCCGIDPRRKSSDKVSSTNAKGTVL